MFESWYASRPTPESAELLDRIRTAGRSEAQAAAGRLVAVGELYVARLRDSGEAADWALDTWDAVSAQIGAALNCSIAMASSYLRYAVAMRDRLPAVGTAFRAGDIDYRAFQTIVFRTDLIKDDGVMARVDMAVAERLSNLPSLTRGRLARDVDRIVARVDADAVRRAKDAIDDRYVDVITQETGMAYVTANLLDTVGRALDRRLGELVATVCDRDPRSPAQRRADALGALVAGADRLACSCGTGGCPGATRPSASNVVIHVVAEQATVLGEGSTPGVVLGSDGLISSQVVAEIAKTAQLQPLAAPDASPELRYTPSARLAAFVRCRDLTCRAPGCDRPAVDRDLDHTVAYHVGGPTHASNLKALCRKHHLLKTFGNWRDVQLTDGTVVWFLPDGRSYVTIAGGQSLFAGLRGATCESLPAAPASSGACTNRSVRMPTRAHTRSQNRVRRVDAERRRNRAQRDAASMVTATDTAPPPF